MFVWHRDSRIVRDADQRQCKRDYTGRLPDRNLESDFVRRVSHHFLRGWIRISSMVAAAAIPCRGSSFHGHSDNRGSGLRESNAQSLETTECSLALALMRRGSITWTLQAVSECTNSSAASGAAIRRWWPLSPFPEKCRRIEGGEVE